MVVADVGHYAKAMRGLPVVRFKVRRVADPTLMAEAPLEHVHAGGLQPVTYTAGDKRLVARVVVPLDVPYVPARVGRRRRGRPRCRAERGEVVVEAELEEEVGDEGGGVRNEEEPGGEKRREEE